MGAIYATMMLRLELLPDTYVVNFMIFSMAGYFAGISKAPFTAIVLVTEMVGTLQHLMPLAVVSLVSYIVVDALGGAPIYQSLLERLNTGKRLNQFSGKNDRLEIPVFSGSHFSGRQIRDINWPNSSLLVAIRRGEREIIPNGDTLILITDKRDRITTRKMLSDMSGIKFNEPPDTKSHLK